MSPSEKVRVLLDERGIEHDDNDANTKVTGVRITRWKNGGKRDVRYEEWRNGTTRLDAGNVSPEQAIAATIGAGTCHYIPDDAGFTWWDENDVEHYEEYSASDECDSASCDKCGFPMMVGEEGWFDGWDEITEWTEEDGSEHKGYVLKPRFKFCPKCGRHVEQ